MEFNNYDHKPLYDKIIDADRIIQDISDLDPILYYIIVRSLFVTALKTKHGTEEEYIEDLDNFYNSTKHLFMEDEELPF
jgi:hypothetical protein